MRAHSPLIRLRTLIAAVAVWGAAPGAQAAEGPRAIAVLPFQQLQERPEDAYLRAGFAETLTTALARLRTLRVVERGQLQRVLDELKVQQSGMVDEGQAAKLGRLVGAHDVVIGSYMRVGNTFSVTCRFVDVASAAIDPDHAVAVKRKLASEEEVFLLLDDVVDAVLKGFGVQPSVGEQQQMQAVTRATAQVSAFQHYVAAREKYLLFTLEGYAQAVPLFEKAVGVDNGYALAWAGLAEALGMWGYQQQQNGEDATALYRRCLEAAKRAAALAPGLGEAHRALAQAYSHIGEEGDNNAARSRRYLDAARRAVALNDRDAEAHYMLWAGLGRPLQGEGFAHIRKALELNPDLAAAHVDLGVAFAGAGRLREAVPCYEAAVRTNPRYPIAWIGLGSVRHQLGQADQAVDAFRKAVALQPANALAWFHLGDALSRQGKRDEAMDAYRKAVEANPRLTHAWVNLGNAYDALGRLDDAVAAFRKAVAVDPDYASAYFNLGNAFLKQQKTDDAIAAYEDAVRADPNFATPYFTLAVLQRQKGEKGEAINAMRRFVGLAREDPAQKEWVARGEQFLREIEGK